MAWSYDLLPAPERRLFARLAVFAGGWTLEAAEAVCAGEGLDPADVLDLLSQLVDKSLVVVEEEDGGGEVRYRLLETLREYAARAPGGEGEAAGRKRGAPAPRRLLPGPGRAGRRGGSAGAAQAHWLARLETEHDNLRQALRWAVETGETELGLRLGVALWRFWNAHAYLSEGREWLGRVLDLPGVAPGSAARRRWPGCGARPSPRPDPWPGPRGTTAPPGPCTRTPWSPAGPGRPAGGGHWPSSGWARWPA